MGAGFGVGEGVVMMPQVVAASGGDGLELVVFQRPAEASPRCRQGIVEHVVGIVHLVDPEHGFQTRLVEACIVGHEWKALDQRGPNISTVMESGTSLIA